jgi:hypothetical protein
MKTCRTCDHWDEWGKHCMVYPVRERRTGGKVIPFLAVKYTDDPCDIAKWTPRLTEEKDPPQ